jgi:NitT/TauT family transport system permease protein
MRADPAQRHSDTAVVERQLSLLERAWASGFVRKTLIVIFLGVVWEVYGRFLDNPLLFPTLTDPLITMKDRIADGTIPMRAWTSIKILLMGYASGIALAAALTILAINTRIGAWRTLIAAELIFGVSSGKGGLGWFIF